MDVYIQLVANSFLLTLLTELLQSATRLYAVFDFLDGLDRFTGGRLTFLRSRCIESTTSLGQPFAVFMTNVTLESTLQLTWFESVDPFAAQTDRSDCMDCQNEIFFLDSHESHYLMLIKCLKFLNLGLREMHECSLFEELFTSDQPLACYLDDRAAQAIWLQVSDLGALLPQILVNKAILFSQIFNHDAENRTVTVLISILTVYLSWLCLYHTTHFLAMISENIESEHRGLDELADSLIHTSLEPIGSILGPAVCSHLSGGLPDSSLTLMDNCIVSLAKMSQLHPKIVSWLFTLSWNTSTFSELLIQWLSTHWILDQPSGSSPSLLVKLSAMRLLNQYLHTAVQSTNESFISQVVSLNRSLLCSSYMPCMSSPNCELVFYMESLIFTMLSAQRFVCSSSEHDRQFSTVISKCETLLPIMKSRFPIESPFSPHSLLSRVYEDFCKSKRSDDC